MKVPERLRPILYGAGVFVLFTTLVIVMKVIMGRMSADAEYFGILSNKEVLMGLIVALLVTFSHERKKRLK